MKMKKSDLIIPAQNLQLHMQMLKRKEKINKSMLMMAVKIENNSMQDEMMNVICLGISIMNLYRAILPFFDLRGRVNKA